MFKLFNFLFGKKFGGVRRSSNWSKVRKKFVKKNSFCAVCGSKKKLQVHHIKPFHLYPELELDENNLIVLCGKRCHLLFGHLGSFHSYNLNIKQNAKEWRDKIKTRP